MQRYLRPDLLEAAGIEVFDTWAATFGQVVSQVELAPEGGSSFRMKSRFARFANVPEMLRMLHVAADVKTAEDLALPVPDLRQRADGQRAPETVTVEPSEELLAYVRDLGERAAKVRNRAVGPEEDNMLKISGDGRRAALDLRLLGLPQTAPGKITAAADRIAAIWKAHRGRRVLRPRRHPVPGTRITAAGVLRPGHPGTRLERLRRAPRPARWPAGCRPRRSGSSTRPRPTGTRPSCSPPAAPARVAVLVGSTEKMGVGTNVQDRAIALHHLDAPWRPADVAQREGRILRQGNLNRNSAATSRSSGTSPNGPSTATCGRPSNARPGSSARSCTAASTPARSPTSATPRCPSARSRPSPPATRCSWTKPKPTPPWPGSSAPNAPTCATRKRSATRSATSTPRSAGSPSLAAAIDTAIAQRQDTRGEKFTMTVDQMHHSKRADAGQHVKDILEREAAGLTGQLRRAVTIGQPRRVRGNAEVTRSLGATNVTITLRARPARRSSCLLPASAAPTLSAWSPDWNTALPS